MINTFKQDLISVKEVAKHVGKLEGEKPNSCKIKRWMRTGTKEKGKLRSVKIGRVRFTTKQEVDLWLNEPSTSVADVASPKRSPKLNAKLEARAELLGI